MFHALLFVLSLLCFAVFVLFLLGITALGVAADIGQLAGVVRGPDEGQSHNAWLFDVARGRMFGAARRPA